MDTNMALLTTGTSGTIITVLYFLYKMLNHRRCRSSCCGKKMEASIDVESTTPPDRKKESFTTNAPKIEVVS